MCDNKIHAYLNQIKDSIFTTQHMCFSTTSRYAFLAVADRYLLNRGYHKNRFECVQEGHLQSSK